MNERQMQFRVGIFVLITVSIGGFMLFQFGQVKTLLRPTFAVSARFESATGIHPSTPVRMYGLTVGEVDSVQIDQNRGGVIVRILIDEKHRISKDVTPRIVTDLLGGAVIEFLPGTSLDQLTAGTELTGKAAESPMDAVRRLEEQVNRSLGSFVQTSEEWRRVGTNVNTLLESHDDSIQQVMAKSIGSLDEFTKTMQSASQTLTEAQTALTTVNSFLNDPEYQKQLTATVEALPILVQQTSDTITAAKSTIESIDANLVNLKKVTDPLASKSEVLTTKIENTLTNVENLTGHLNIIGELMAKEEGTIVQFLSNPAIVQNLNSSTAGLTLMLANLQPILKDVSIFSDKIARHPELLGVGGAISGSSGLKSPPVTPASYERRATQPRAPRAN